LQQLQARIKSNPQDIRARLELGSAYESYGLYDSALDQYKEAFLQSPATDVLVEQAIVGLSRAARASYRIAEAVPILEETLAQRPGGNSWNELGLLYEDIASLSAAQNAFEHAIAANPESDTAHNNLGNSLLLQSRVEAAESEFRKAVELNPRSVRARNNLAIVLARRGDIEGALEQFLMTADAATAHNNLAVVLLEAGKYEQSREQLVEALTIRHYFPPALANFKIVQERLREEVEVKKYGRLPLNPLRMPSSLVALGQMTTQEPEDTK
jgi:superkiller protein 3